MDLEEEDMERAIRNIERRGYSPDYILYPGIEIKKGSINLPTFKPLLHKGEIVLPPMTVQFNKLQLVALKAWVNDDKNQDWDYVTVYDVSRESNDGEIGTAKSFSTYNNETLKGFVGTMLNDGSWVDMIDIDDNL